MPTRSQDIQPLQNVLSISTAGKNRYLFHFNSLHSLTQWTAGIRLAMFEHTTLQEAYTGSLIAGKGKTLNNIKVIMDRTKFRTEDWARVRFGAGTPWRRCWCVITPPDEKEVHKQQKSLKKKSAYDRAVPTLKGNIKFYDTKKTKKTLPIATIRDAYSAYAIYPQSKPLIDQSTLVKVEGTITIHSTPETTQEGFVFVMPEVHPAVTGFEMMLRWLFPLYDVFALYGRPTRLIADTLDVRSLMFALPQEKRYGYLEILDVAGLIHEPGSQTWTEKEWRKKLKEVTSTRVTRLKSNGARSRSRASSYRGHRNSLPSRAGTLRYEDAASIRSSPSVRDDFAPTPPPHTGSAPPGNGPFRPPKAVRTNSHQRSVSEASPYSTPSPHKSQLPQDDQHNYTPSRLSYEASAPNGSVPLEPMPPVPPVHAVPLIGGMRNPQVSRYAMGTDSPNRSSSESERRMRNGTDIEAQEIHQDVRPISPPAPVAAPPAFAHEPGVKPPKRPGISPEMRRATSRLSITTLSQLADSGRLNTAEATAAAGAAAAWRSRSNTAHVDGRTYEAQGENGYAQSLQRDVGFSEDGGQRGVIDDSSKRPTTADHSSASEGILLGEATPPTSMGHQKLAGASSTNKQNQLQPGPGYRDYSPQSRSGLQATANSTSRSVSPLSQSYANTPPSSQQPTQDMRASRNSSRYEVPAHEAPFADAYYQDSPPRAPITPQDQRPDLSRINTSRSITRKPVPNRDRSQSQVSELPTPASKTSLESLRQHVLDEEALKQIGANHDSRTNTMDSNVHQPSDAGSVYDDDSTASPDYASTRKSTETKRSRPSVDKPRAGKLKTVGTIVPEQKEVVVGDARYNPDFTSQEVNPDIPTVDFGPTQVYNPKSSSRPSTSETMVPQMDDNPKAQERDDQAQQYESSTPNNVKEIVSPSVMGRQNEPHDRAPSRSMTTPDIDRRMSSAEPDQDRRRSVAWQPGAIIGGGSPGNRQSITPEQFVQQRAAANRVTPVYAHARKASGSNTPPPPSRNVSGEVPSQQYLRSTSYARELQASPRTRGAPSPTANDYTNNLSAREQEHVARATGSPLVNVASNPKKQTPQPSGLVGAIEAREQEKKDIRQGYSNTAVQHAIAQRQQHGQSYSPRQPSYNIPTPQMQIPGQWPQTPNSFVQTPGQYPPQAAGYVSSQYGYGVPQQQQQQYQNQMYDQPQYAQQQQYQPHWTPPAGLQHVNTQQYSQQPQPYQQTAFQQQQAVRQQQGYYQTQQAQNQQQYYGPYFGNGQNQQR